MNLQDNECIKSKYLDIYLSGYRPSEYIIS